MIFPSAVDPRLEGFFRGPNFELLNPAFTNVSSASPLLCRHLILLRDGFPFPFQASEVSGSSGLLLRRANQLSSPIQKHVISEVRADTALGLSWLSW